MISVFSTACLEAARTYPNPEATCTHQQQPSMAATPLTGCLSNRSLDPVVAEINELCSEIDTPCLLWWIHALMESGQDVRSKIYHTKLYCLSIYSPKLSVWPTSNFSISPVDDLTMAGWPSGALLLSKWAVGICVVQEHWIWSLLFMKQIMTPIWEGLVE